MNNVVLSTRNIDDFISDIANEVIKKLESWNIKPQQPTEPQDKFLTIQQASKFLNLTVPTIYSKVSRRQIPFMKRGKRLYFSQLELIDYVKSGRIKTNAEIEAEAESYLSDKKKGLNNG